MSHIQLITVQTADEILAQNSNAILLDARRQQDFELSHHPKSLFLNESLLDFMLKHVQKCTPILIYSYNGNTSKDIARLFATFGYVSCYSINGGFVAWKSKEQIQFPLTPSAACFVQSIGGQQEKINLAVDSYLRTPLMHACHWGFEELVKDLIDAGADPNVTDKYGNNALFYALINGDENCLRHILNADVEVDNRNTYGFNAIHYIIGNQQLMDTLSKIISQDALVKMRRLSSTRKNFRRFSEVANNAYA